MSGAHWVVAIHLVLSGVESLWWLAKQTDGQRVLNTVCAAGGLAAVAAVALALRAGGFW